MKGYAMPPESLQEPVGQLAGWESLVVEACGNVIEFWGFKRNQGRVWAVLYLRGRPLSSGEIIGELGLSKGAVSMLTRELEGWGVVRRVRGASDGISRFAAETDLMRMIGRVLGQRETALVTRVKDDLDEALAQAQAAGAPLDVRERIERMRTLAALVEQAVRLFQQTARFDVTRAISVLHTARGFAKRRK
jgi:DNA-binding transcriptional regulator GbsR (MarR family)